MAPQADRTEAGETHGKSCHLKDTRQEDYVFLGGLLKLLDLFHSFFGHKLFLGVFVVIYTSAFFVVSGITAVPV